ncbi:MAG: DNRLRE domain-containing protein, partial [Pirellulaceae bacterium]
GGSLTVAVTAGAAPAEDVLSIQSGAIIGFDGSNVTHQGTTIGIATGGSNGNALVVSLNNSATPATVSSLIRTLTYANPSISPSLAARTVTVSLDDGDGTDNGGQSTGIATVTITISPVNAAPAISGLDGDVLPYLEGGGPKSMDQGAAASVTDVDSPDFDGGSLTASLTANAVAAEDVLSVEAVGDISVSGLDVSYQGTVIGTVSGGDNASDLVVSFNSAATLSAVSELLGAISYQNTSTDPSENTRTVTFTVKDGDGTENGGADTATVATTIEVTAVNDPVAMSFQEGVFPTSTYSGTQDAAVREDNSASNFGTRDKLFLDGKPNQTAFVSWDVANIPAGSVVQSASITISVVRESADTYSLYELLVPWVEGEVTYIDRSLGTAWDVAGAQGANDRGSTVLGTTTSPTISVAVITLNSAGVAVVQSWIDNPNQNYGIVFQNFEDANTDDLDFVSSEGSDPLTRPKLAVSYFPAPASGVASPTFQPSVLQNSDNPYDVNDDEQVSSMDVLIVLNIQNASSQDAANFQAPGTFPDVSGDRVVSPLDALLVINYLNLPDAIDTDTDLDVDSDGVALGEGEGMSYEVFVVATGTADGPLQIPALGNSRDDSRAASEAGRPNSLFPADPADDDSPGSRLREYESFGFDSAFSSDLESTLEAICEDLGAGSVADGLAPDGSLAAFFAELGTGKRDDESN